MNKVLLYISLMGLVNLLTGIIVVRIAKGKKEPPPVPCDNCRYLLKKGGGLYKYYCRRPGSTLYDCFNNAPEYCGEWKQR